MVSLAGFGHWSREPTGTGGGDNCALFAAGLARDSELRNYFQQQSLERARFRVELTDAIKKGLESLSSTRAAAAQPCFIERGSNSKMISEEETTRCWKVLSREKTVQLCQERAQRSGERNFFIILSSMAGAVSIARVLTEASDKKRVLDSVRDHLLRSF